MKDYKTIVDLLLSPDWSTYCPERADLTGAVLRFANLTGANLTGANLTDAVLRFANLTDANLTGAVLRNANLTGAVLRNANLTGANLTEAVLRNAILTGANLAEAVLRNANLTGANLPGAVLRNADLRDANLTGADLRDANLSQTQGLPTARDFLSQFDRDEKGIIVYRVWRGHYSCPASWKEEPGSVITETPNPSRTCDCGCGVSFATREWLAFHFPDEPVWKCRIDFYDLADVVVPYQTSGKARCARLTLLEKVS